jgi:bifunctional non-homologous end joining protein LigD
MKKDMDKVPFRVSPMLATLVDRPFSKAGWVFEEKYDGVRMLAYKEGPKVSLVSRNGIDRSSRYPTITSEIAKIKAKTLLLDGEIVAFDSHKISRFQLLQNGRGEVKYAVFDCLCEDGKDFRREPLAVRRKVLEEVLKPGPIASIAKRLAADGVKAFEIATRRGLEGVVAKDSSAPYTEGRSADWLKFKINQQEEFVIGGYTMPEGSRHYFGALLLGAFRGRELRYVGKVGTGFNEQSLGSLHRKMKTLTRTTSPFSSDVREKGATFISPKLVAQIAFTERTSEGKLRHPVYLGLRDDKPVRDVRQ